MISVFVLLFGLAEECNYSLTLVVFDLKKKFSYRLILLTFLMLGLVCAVNADIPDFAEISGHAMLDCRTLSNVGCIEPGFRLSQHVTSDHELTRIYQIVVDTSSVDTTRQTGIITQPPNPISPPAGCTISGWGTKQLTIWCSPGLRVGYDAYTNLTDIMIEDANGAPVNDFTGAKITEYFKGQDCIFSGTFGNPNSGFPGVSADFGGNCRLEYHSLYLYIDSNPQGAEILINGEKFYEVTPFWWSSYDQSSVNVQLIPPDSITPSKIYHVDLKHYKPTYLYIDLTKGSPEFPSALMPAALIIGFLGAVLLLQRTRDK